MTRVETPTIVVAMEVCNDTEIIAIYVAKFEFFENPRPKPRIFKKIKLCYICRFMCQKFLELNVQGYNVPRFFNF